jgi:hypothetical protein
MRGGVIGDFLFWLVAAATATGFVFVLLGEDPAPSPGTAEELAERLEPIGRVVLAAPAAPAEGTADPQILASVPAVSEVADAADASVEGQKAEEAPVREPKPEPAVGATQPPAPEAFAAAGSPRLAPVPGKGSRETAVTIV